MTETLYEWKKKHDKVKNEKKEFNLFNKETYSYDSLTEEEILEYIKKIDKTILESIDKHFVKDKEIMIKANSIKTNYLF